jgi:hypothetical protein
MLLVLTVNPYFSATLTDWIVELKGSAQNYQLPIINGVSNISLADFLIPIDSSTSLELKGILSFSYTDRIYTIIPNAFT